MATILHVDMDAFFASVELLHHPEWRGKPLIVGSGPHERGVVSTCSYEARRFGVHSAMPSRTAYERCPQAIFTPPHMKLYREVSAHIFEIFGHYTPFVEGVSIDEAFLDITGTTHIYGNDLVRFGEALRREVHETCGVTCSVGIAPNRLLAKIGSEQNKPNGLTIMPFERQAILEFLAPKPVGILWGVGEKTRNILKCHSLMTCGDIQREPLARLRATLHSEEIARTLISHACGIDDSVVAYDPVPDQSVSREYTFAEDEYNREVVRLQLLKLVNEVGFRFRREKRWARTARLKLRDAAFQTQTRQMSFDTPARDDMAFRKAALTLFDQMWPPCAGNRHLTIRLIGFGVTNIQTSPEQDPTLSLFTFPEDTVRNKNERLSAALDALHSRGLSTSLGAEK